MNQKDLKIISMLRTDARMPLTKMSKEIRVPVSTIFDRLRAHEESLIVRHTALLDFAKMGYNARANITLKAGREQRDALRQYLINSPQVNSVYKINNGYDFMIEGVFTNIKEMELFMDAVEQRFNIEDKEVYYIVEDIKKESFLSDPRLVDILYSKA